MLSYARDTFVDYLAYSNIPLADELINITIAVEVEIIFGIKLVDRIPVCLLKTKKKFSSSHAFMQFSSDYCLEVMMMRQGVEFFQLFVGSRVFYSFLILH